MTNREDVQSFLDRLQLPVEPVAEDIWRLRTTEGVELVVHYAPPVLLLRVRILEIPKDPARATQLYHQLLVYNASDLVHGSYGIEGDHVVLTDALLLADLDYSEFEASVESLLLALSSHLSVLMPFGGN